MPYKLFSDLESRDDKPHTHTCASCGHAWSHTAKAMSACSDAEHKQAHTCSKCGAEQYEKTVPKEDLPKLEAAAVRAVTEMGQDMIETGKMLAAIKGLPTWIITATFQALGRSADLAASHTAECRKKMITDGRNQEYGKEIILQVVREQIARKEVEDAARKGQAGTA